MEKYLLILRSCPFFSGMTDEEILTILHCMDARTKKLDRNTYIFRAGESIETMGLVLNGSVLVIQEDLWGHRNILAKILPGDFFGERQHGLPQMRMATLVEDLVLLEQAGQAAHELLRRDPKLKRPEHIRLLKRVRELFDRQTGNLN